MNFAFNTALFASAALLIAAATPASQQSTPPAASQRIPQFENAEVSVWKTTVMPNAPLQMHTHDHPRVLVALQGGTVKIAYADGGSETQHWEAGKAYWLGMEEGKRRHADVNLGDKPIEVMVVELKNSK